jgi:hypothetical protein
MGCPWDASTTAGIAVSRYDHLNILKWALRNGGDWDYFTICLKTAQKVIYISV